MWPHILTTQGGLLTDRPEHDWLHYTHAQALTKTHTHTHTTVLSIHRHAGGNESRGTALRHSLNMQQAVLNKQENWMEEEEGVRGKTDWLGICEREGWRYSVSYCKVIEGGKKEGSEEKKRRQVYRKALTDHRWLKDMWKGCSQNTALPSWTFYSAVSCSWCKRQRKRNTPVNSCLSLDSWEEWNLRLSVWRLRSVAKRGLHFYIDNLGTAALVEMVTHYWWNGSLMGTLQKDPHISVKLRFNP